MRTHLPVVVGSLGKTAQCSDGRRGQSVDVRGKIGCDVVSTGHPRFALAPWICAFANASFWKEVEAQRRVTVFSIDNTRMSTGNVYCCALLNKHKVYKHVQRPFYSRMKYVLKMDIRKGGWWGNTLNPVQCSKTDVVVGAHTRRFLHTLVIWHCAPRRASNVAPRPIVIPTCSLNSVAGAWEQDLPVIPNKGLQYLQFIKGCTVSLKKNAVVPESIRHAHLYAHP